MTNVLPPEKTEIKVDGWPGYSVIVPNGTSIYLVNQFLADVLDWTYSKSRPTPRATDEKPISALQKWLAAIRRQRAIKKG